MAQEMPAVKCLCTAPVPGNHISILQKEKPHLREGVQCVPYHRVEEPSWELDARKTCLRRQTLSSLPQFPHIQFENLIY